jgi:hypothetical protein
MLAIVASCSGDFQLYPDNCSIPHQLVIEVLVCVCVCVCVHARARACACVCACVCVCLVPLAIFCIFKNGGS